MTTLSNGSVTTLAELLRLDDWSCDGEELKARCPNPLHDDNRPSWSLNLLEGVHHCFSCQYGGSIYSLIYDLNVSKGKALLAWGRAKREPTPFTNGAKNSMGIADIRWPITDKMLEPYLQSVPPHAQKRIRDPNIINAYKIGCDPDTDRTVFVTYGTDFNATGVWAENRDHPKYILIAPRDAKERGALFGLHLPPTKYTVVCEGFYQAMAVYGATGYRSLATMGTSVTEAQRTMLAQCSPIIIMFDGDLAGKVGRDKLAEYMLNIRGAYGFVAGGYYQDPDDIDPEELRQILHVDNLRSLYMHVQNVHAQRLENNKRGLPPL